jgi:acyl carrier protein
MATSGRQKVIIMDKAPNFNSLNMQTTLGFEPVDYVALATAFNQELGTQVTAADIDSFATVEELVAYMESL